MNRRRFIKTALGALGAAGIGYVGWREFGGGLPGELRDPGKPNVILITADDLGWKDVGCYGNNEIKTPNIDRLAREGVLCQRAFGVTSSCAPSRASFITGQYPHTNGVTGLTHIHKFRSLSPFHTTLPDLLSAAGYVTALEGKWHVSPYLPASMYGYRERLSGMLPKDMWIQDASRSVAFIEQNKDRRFYLELNYMNNHRDAYGEFAFADGFPVDPDSIHVPEYWNLPDWPEIRLEAAKFYSQTMIMDHMIGEVLNTLDRLGLAENTMVIFVSDNGPPFPGNKMTLYDRGVATPLLFRWPSAMPSNGTRDGLVSTLEIMPTILDAVGLEIPFEVQGRSILNVLKSNQDRPIRDAVFSEMTDHVYYLPTRSARTDRWKYIRNYSDIAAGLDQCNHMDWAHRVCELPGQPWKEPRQPEELYDLDADPNERTNLVDRPEYAEPLAAMRRLLDAHMKDTEDPYLGALFTNDYKAEMYAKKTDSEKYK